MVQRQSGLGIASFLIALGMAMVIFLLLTAAALAEVNTPGGLSTTSGTAILLSLLLIASLLVDLIALALGIAGSVQKGYGKTLAVLGAAISGLTLAAVILLVIVGNTMP